MINENQTILAVKTNTGFTGFTDFNEETGIAFNHLIEQVWQGLNCQVRRERVHELVLEEVSPFQDAIAAQCIPSLIHRRVRARLIEETT